MNERLAWVCTHCRRAAVVTVLVAATTGIAQAGPHRARLSKDLADRLAAGDQRSTRVIVSGSEELVVTLATRYGARVTKTLRGGAVLEVTGGQLDALSQDPDVDHLSGDVPVHRMMALANEAIGADQLLTVLMPYRTSSPASQGDAEEVVQRLGTASELIEITPMVDGFFGPESDASSLRRRFTVGRARVRLRQRVAQQIGPQQHDQPQAQDEGGGRRSDDP